MNVFEAGLVENIIVDGKSVTVAANPTQFDPPDDHESLEYILMTTEPTMAYTTRIENLTANDLTVAGGKGANLGELVGAGLPVPSGFVVTTDAYEAFIDTPVIGSTRSCSRNFAELA